MNGNWISKYTERRGKCQRRMSVTKKQTYRLRWKLEAGFQPSDKNYGHKPRRVVWVLRSTGLAAGGAGHGSPESTGRAAVRRAKEGPGTPNCP